MKNDPSVFLTATQRYDSEGRGTITTVTSSGHLSHRQMVDLAAGLLFGIAETVDLLDRQGGGTGLVADVQKRFNEISQASHGVEPLGGRAFTIARPEAGGTKGV